MVFNTFPVDQRQGATNFSELLDIRLAAARAVQETELYTVVEIGDAIADQLALQQGILRKEAEYEEQEKTVSGLDGQINELTSKADSGRAARLGEVSGAYALRLEQLQAIKRRASTLESLDSAIRLARTSAFPRQAADLRSKYALAGLTEAEWTRFVPDFVGDVDAIVQTSLADTRKIADEVAGSPELGVDQENLDSIVADRLHEQSVANLLKEQRRLEKLVGLDDQRRQKLIKLRDQLTAGRGKLKRLGDELNAAKNSGPQIEILTKSRLEHYAAYFDALLQEERELKVLYAPLRTVLDSSGSSVAKLRFSVRRKVDIGEWARDGEELLDLRKAGPFRAQVSLDGELSKDWSQFGRLATVLL